MSTDPVMASQIKKLEKQVAEHEEKLDILVSLVVAIKPELLEDFLEWKKGKGGH